jgi:hypothetical protein
VARAKFKICPRCRMAGCDRCMNTGEVLDIPKLAIATYGCFGEHISGSVMWRSYCRLCGEPMRTSYRNRSERGVVCTDCDGHHGKGSLPGRRSDGYDSSPEQQNAIRHMEERQ